MQAISYDVCLSVWLISLSIVLSRSIHIVANGRISFFFCFLRNFCSGYPSGRLRYFNCVWSTLSGLHCFQQQVCCQSYLLFPCMHVRCLFSFGCFIFYFIFLFLILNIDIMSFHVFFIFLPGVLWDFGFVVCIFHRFGKVLTINFPNIFPYPHPWGSNACVVGHFMSHSWLMFCTYFLSLFSIPFILWWP